MRRCLSGCGRPRRSSSTSYGRSLRPWSAAMWLSGSGRRITRWRRRPRMQVDFRTLHPNPRRDFRIDPLDLETIANLKKSIEEDGFWGGIVCRQLADGTIQIAAGHHRVATALDVGISVVDVLVA